MKCKCNEAKQLYLIANRMNLADGIGIMCLRCEKIWTTEKPLSCLYEVQVR